MNEILESILNGQRKQAIEQLKDSGICLEDLFEELEKEEIIRMYKVAEAIGYIVVDE